MKGRIHWGWIAAYSLFIMAGAGYYEAAKYGKPPTVALSYLLCLALFWKLTPRTAWWTLGAGVASGLIRLLFVKPISRQRPSNLSFSQPLEPIFGSTSFPSGHTTTSFAIAAFIAWAVWNSPQRALAPLVLIWAAGVGLARIYVGVHYPLDIIGGACVGIAVGTFGWTIALDRGGLSFQDQAAPSPSSPSTGTSGSDAP
jgi:membrane-associated phospholipid phosphatase